MMDIPHSSLFDLLLYSDRSISHPWILRVPCASGEFVRMAGLRKEGLDLRA